MTIAMVSGCVARFPSLFMRQSSGVEFWKLLILLQSFFMFYLLKLCIFYCFVAVLGGCAASTLALFAMLAMLSNQFCISSELQVIGDGAML